MSNNLPKEFGQKYFRKHVLSVQKARDMISLHGLFDMKRIVCSTPRKKSTRFQGGTCPLLKTVGNWISHAFHVRLCIVQGAIRITGRKIFVLNRSDLKIPDGHQGSAAD